MNAFSYGKQTPEISVSNLRMFTEWYSHGAIDCNSVRLYNM